MPNLKFLLQPFARYYGGTKITKLGHVTHTWGSQEWITRPQLTSFDQILRFLSLELTAFRLRAKFEVACFNRLRDIRRVPKVDHVTPHDPF